MKGSCKVAGCRARAWHLELCNYHALLELRGKTPKPDPDVARLRQVVREHAAGLGIALDEEVEQVQAVARRVRKARSPVF